MLLSPQTFRLSTWRGPLRQALRLWRNLGRKMEVAEVLGVLEVHGRDPGADSRSLQFRSLRRVWKRLRASTRMRRRSDSTGVVLDPDGAVKSTNGTPRGYEAGRKGAKV